MSKNKIKEIQQNAKLQGDKFHKKCMKKGDIPSAKEAIAAYGLVLRAEIILMKK
jgi:hypothetical protein